MHREPIEIVQMMLPFICIPLLLFVINRSNKREIAQVPERIKRVLEGAQPDSVEDSVAKKIKKSRAIHMLVAFFITMMLKNYVENSMYRAEHRKMINPTSQEVEELWMRTINTGWAVVAIGIILFISWYIYDYFKIRNSKDKRLIPAYVQSIFTNPKHKTRSAELVYYDYKKKKYSLKWASIDKLEKQFRLINPGCMLSIIVREKTKSIKYISLSENINNSGPH